MVTEASHADRLFRATDTFQNRQHVALNMQMAISSMDASLGEHF
jgi:hypothetical protein